jgi:hypothetical protein
MSFIAPRLRSFDYIGEYRYSLTFCTFDRQRYFEDPETVRVTLTQIGCAAQGEGFDVPVYCVTGSFTHSRDELFELVGLART